MGMTYNDRFTKFWRENLTTLSGQVILIVKGLHSPGFCDKVSVMDS